MFFIATSFEITFLKVLWFFSPFSIKIKYRKLSKFVKWGTAKEEGKKLEYFIEIAGINDSIDRREERKKECHGDKWDKGQGKKHDTSDVRIQKVFSMAIKHFHLSSFWYSFFFFTAMLF